ncbi:MAG: hypothetical protein AAF488_16455, partial [Planctomycetota bacterium]
MLSRILLGVLFIVGAAAGYGVAKSGGEDDLSILDPVDAPSDSAPNATALSGDASARPVKATSVEEAIAALASFESYEARDGSIVGTVATEAGVPLEGVTVIARSQEKLPGYEDPADLETEAALRQGLALYGLRRGLTSTAVTDETGVFRVEQIGSGPYGMHAELDGYRFVPAEDERRGRHVSAGDEVSLIGLPAGRLKIEFAGIAPPEATVKVLGADQRSFRWTSDRDPLTVAAGEITVEASTPTAMAEPVVAVVQAGEETSVSLDLRSKLSIAGRLIGPPGFRTHRQAVVRVVQDRPGLTEESIVRADDAKSEWVHVGTTYRIEVPAPGRYLLAAGLDYSRVDRMIPVDVIDGSVRVDLELPEVDISKVARVKLLDPRGQPLADELQFQISVTHENGSYGSGGEGHRQDNGEYWVFIDPDQFEVMGPESTVTLTVTSMDYGSASFEVDPETLYGEHTFVKPASVEVTLSNWATTRLQGLLSVSLVPTEEGGRGYSQTSSQIDAEGKARFEKVAPGLYDVQLSVKSRERYRGAQAVLREPIEVLDGERAVTIVVPELYELIIEFEETTNLRQVSVQPVDDDRGGTWIEVKPGSKEVVASNLPAGRYRLRAMGMRSDQMTVDLRRDTRVQFEADVVNALRVSIRDSTGELAKAGFQDGDLIVAIGGQPFKSSTDVQMAMVGMMARPEVSVTITTLLRVRLDRPSHVSTHERGGLDRVLERRTTSLDRDGNLRTRH